MSTGIRTDASGLFGALQVGGADVLRFGSDNSGQLAGFRNRIINGAMEIWQRAASIACPAGTETYTADRWVVIPTGAAATATRTAFGTSSGRVRYALQVQGASGITSLELVHRIEAANSFNLAGKTIKVSAVLYQNSGSNWSGCLARIFRANTADTFSGITQEDASRTFSLANNTPTKFTWTFTLSANATTGIELAIDTLNALPAATGFAITEVQLEEGSIATPFENRPIGLELSLCQRYYEVGLASNRLAVTGLATTGSPIGFKVPKRTASPSVAFGTPTVSFGVTSGPFADNATSDGFTLRIAGTTDFGWTGPYTASAEL